MINRLHHTGFVVTDRNKSVACLPRRGRAGAHRRVRAHRPRHRRRHRLREHALIIANLDLGGGHILSSSST